MREMQIFDFKKKIAESETKLKQQQNLYEAVRSDRNLYSKNLIESQVTAIYIHVYTQIAAILGRSVAFKPGIRLFLVNFYVVCISM